MVYVHIHHKVQDFDTWKPYFDDHDQTRIEMGQQNYQLFQSNDDPNDVVLVTEVDTMENARSFMESDDLREAMKEAGVIGKPEITYLDRVEYKEVPKSSA